MKIEKKDKRLPDLINVNQQVTFRNEKKGKSAAKLIIADKVFDVQSEKKKKLETKLILANKKNKDKETFQKENILWLEEMMFIVSHKIRQPVANILGISSLLDNTNNSPADLKKMVAFMKQSALSLDNFTKELSAFICKIKTQNSRLV
jgi:signal transduction histidine kinase